MKKSLIVLLLFPLSLNVLAAVDDTEQKLHNVAKPSVPQMVVPDISRSSSQKEVIEIDEQQLYTQPQLTHKLLTDALFQHQYEAIEVLLKVYRTFSNTDPILIEFAEAQLATYQGNTTKAIIHYRHILSKNPNLNAVRIELARALFTVQQNSAAEDQFNKAKSVGDLPLPVSQLIDAYLNALQKRNNWQFGGSFYYLNDKNVTHTSSSPEIENTGYVKSKNMLPQKAHGFAYNFYLNKDFNLIGSHYLSLQDDLYGKSYWDKHEEDNLTNRTSLGYSYKKETTTFRLLPFFEKRWESHKSNRRVQGIRAELNHWFSPNWQISTVLEYGKQRYYQSSAQNGFSQLASATLMWLRNPKQYFYVGTDINRELVQVKQFSSDTKSVRFGWGQEWNLWGLSCRLNLSFTTREYKDIASLGGILNLGKKRQDKAYSTTITLWKRDWHLWKITPKLQVNWRKNNSNLPTLYSYTEKNINVIFETRF